MTPAQVLQIVNQHSGVDIMKRNRKDLYADPRTIYCKICEEYLPGSYVWQEIGDTIGRDRVSVWHLATKAFPKRKGYKPFDVLYARVEQSVKDLKKRESDLKNRLDAVLQVEIKEGIDRKYAQLLSEQELETEKLRQELRHTIQRQQDPFIAELLELNGIQYAEFKKRAGIMLKAVKSLKTYENTNKKEFNTQPSKIDYR